MRHHAIIDRRLRATEGKISSKCIRDAIASPGREGNSGGRSCAGENRGERDVRERRDLFRLIPRGTRCGKFCLRPADKRSYFITVHAHTQVTVYPFSWWTRRYGKLYPLRRSAYLAFWNASIIMTSDMRCDLAIWIIVPSSDCYGA